MKPATFALRQQQHENDVPTLPARDFRVRARQARVYITDSDSWEASGGFAGAGAAGAGGIAGGGSGGARPQTAEIMKTFGDRCQRVTVTINRDRADYIVILQHEGGKDLFRKDNKLAVFDKEGDMILSNSTRSLGNAVKEA